MNKLSCPHCGKPGISILRRMCLGPAVPATCNACGKKVGVPYTTMLAVIPFVAAILASGLIEHFALKAALWVSGCIVMIIIHLLCFPLEPR
jgi:hypothetical protein